MGAYYARRRRRSRPTWSRALRGQYRIRLDAPVDARRSRRRGSVRSRSKLEPLVGIWAIGLAPTGEKRPLRPAPRAALGITPAPSSSWPAGGRLKINANGPLTLAGLLELAASAFPAGKIPAATVAEVSAFIYERYRNQLIADHDRNAVEAVIVASPPRCRQGGRARARRGGLRRHARGGQPGRGQQAHRQPAQEGRGAAWARSHGPARRAGRTGPGRVDGAPAPEAEPVRAGDFAGSLRTLAQLRQPVDTFFADVMVMADDPAVRANQPGLAGPPAPPDEPGGRHLHAGAIDPCPHRPRP